MMLMAVRRQSDPPTMACQSPATSHEAESRVHELSINVTPIRVSNGRQRRPHAIKALSLKQSQNQGEPSNTSMGILVRGCHTHCAIRIAVTSQEHMKAHSNVCAVG